MKAIELLKIARYQVGMNTTRHFIDQALAELEKQPDLEKENERLKAICLRESGVLKEALKRKHNKSMIAVVASSLEDQALSGDPK